MKHVFFFFLFILQTTQIYSQESEAEMYYPENTLFKKLKVAAVLDSNYKKEYDTLGRQISGRYVEDSVITRYKYHRSGDTLIKYYYYTKGEVENEIYECLWFVYNKTGKITTYQRCQKRYSSESSGCSMEQFFYDGNNRLVTQLIYVNGKHKHPFAHTLQLNDSLLKLVDVYSYTYNNNIVVKKQMMGKPGYRSIDSLYYNKANKHVKTVSRQEQAYLGEFAVTNLCRTKVFTYETNRQTERTGLTYNDGEIDAEEVNEYIYYPNGLKQMWNHTNGIHPISRLSYFVYEFYK